MVKILAHEIADKFSATRKIDVRKMAEQKNMIIGSFGLKDNTSIKFIANKNQLNAVIMKNGKVLSAKGITGTKKKISKLINKACEHLYLKDKLKDEIAENNLYNFVDSFERNYNTSEPELYRYGSLLDISNF